MIRTEQNSSTGPRQAVNALSQKTSVEESRNYAVPFIPLCMGSLKHLDRHTTERYTEENSLGTCVPGVWRSAVQCTHTDRHS